MTSTAEHPTLSVAETAGLLGIRRWLAQQAVNDGSLPSVRVGRRILTPRAWLLWIQGGLFGDEVSARVISPGHRSHVTGRAAALARHSSACRPTPVLWTTGLSTDVDSGRPGAGSAPTVDAARPGPTAHHRRLL
jgi:excisionase family DNA binding protein